VFSIAHVIAGSTAFFGLANMLRSAFIAITLSFILSAPTLAETAFDKGVSLFKAGKYELAVESFRASAGQGINKPTSIYYMAMCYQQLGQLQQAHDTYKFVCTEYPNAPVFGRAFQTMKQIGERLNQLREGSQDGPPGASIALPKEPPEEKFLPKAPLAGANEYIVPYTDEAMDGRMYIDGKINGKSCKFLFDTGAGVMFCRQSFIQKQGWQLEWIKEVAIIPGALREAPAKVAIVKVALGNLVREQKIYVEQDSPDSLYASFDNCPIVGQSFFGDLNYVIDGRRNYITFRRSALKSPSAPAVKLRAGEVPFVRDGSHMVVKAKVNNREVDMYFDTGASQVVFADRHLAQCGLNRPVEATNTIRRTVDGRRDSYAFNVDRIQLGPIEKTEVQAAVLLNTKFTKPLLGQSFLQGLKYTVDPARQTIRFEL
jgi:clan AA aspartic protease (TIGR02281 family)